MFHFLHWLVSHSVCLQFGLKQITSATLPEPICWKQLLATAGKLIIMFFAEKLHISVEGCLFGTVFAILTFTILLASFSKNVHIHSHIH